METSSRVVDGGCHCGNLKLVLHWPAGVAIVGRRCSCTFCRSHGGLWTSHPQARLEIAVARDRELSRYRFGTGTADFLVCARCGVPVAVTSEIEGHHYAVVNVNALAGIDPGDLSEASTDFDGEQVADRLERRRRNWIADVTLLAAPPNEPPSESPP